MPLANVVINKEPSITGVPGEHIYDGMFMSSCFAASTLDAVKTFNFHDDDVIIASYPRSGSTWMQEILYLVTTEADTERALKRDVMERVPLIELGRPLIPNIKPVIERLAKMASPRLMKTHLPRHFFDNMLETKQTKVIVVTRNIKDTLISYYHAYSAIWSLGTYHGSFDDFLQMAEKKQLVHGDWYDFTLGWWEQRNNSNILFVSYEDMTRDVSKVIRQVAEFVGKPLKEEHVRIIRHHVDFDHMKKVRKRMLKDCRDLDFALHFGIGEHILRKGKVGQWKEEFTQENNEELDRVYERRMDGSGLEIDFTV